MTTSITVLHRAHVISSLHQLLSTSRKRTARWTVYCLVVFFSLHAPFIPFCTRSSAARVPLTSRAPSRRWRHLHSSRSEHVTICFSPQSLLLHLQLLYAFATIAMCTPFHRRRCPAVASFFLGSMSESVGWSVNLVTSVKLVLDFAVRSRWSCELRWRAERGMRTIDTSDKG